MSDPAFQDLIAQLTGKAEELKDLKTQQKELETDYPLELEELMLSLKDLRKQTNERKEEHIKLLLESNDQYPEIRERIQLLKEEIAEAKLKLFTMAANASREKGDLDTTVQVQGAPMRLQTQKEIQVYLNGKVIK